MKYVLATLLCLVSCTAVAHGMSEEDRQRILNAGYGGYLSLGAKHMLTGYDHLLFLFGVVFYLTRFKEIVWLITAFTAGHCITLLACTLLQVQANYFLVDAVIALTVMYKAFDNLGGFLKNGITPPSLLRMVFIFGLIHGFGLSTRLQQLPLGDPGAELVLRILSFNVGVEVGQVVALSIMVFFLSRWRKSPTFSIFGMLANKVLMAAGFLLLLMQLHSYMHFAYAEDFPISRDDHAHAHQEMEEASQKARKKLENIYGKGQQK